MPPCDPAEPPKYICSRNSQARGTWWGGVKEGRSARKPRQVRGKWRTKPPPVGGEGARRGRIGHTAEEGGLNCLAVGVAVTGQAHGAQTSRRRSPEEKASLHGGEEKERTRKRSRRGGARGRVAPKRQQHAERRVAHAHAVLRPHTPLFGPV